MTAHSSLAEPLYCKRVELDRSGVALLRQQAEREADVFRWVAKDGRSELLGIGCAARLTASGGERFAAMERAFYDTVAAARWEGTAYRLYAVGGFAFFSRAPKTPWKGWKEAEMVVPQMLLRREGERAELVLACSSRRELAAREGALRAVSAPLSNAPMPRIQKVKEPFIDDYFRAIRSTLAAIASGRGLQKAVIARTLELELERAPRASDLFPRLLEEQPDAYRFSWERPASFWIGASPEQLLKVKGHLAEADCLAGSRGAQAGAEQALLADEKNLEEHRLVVDDVAAQFACSCRSVSKPLNPRALRMRDIVHLHTPIRGELKEGESLLRLAARLHPTPALGGTPRARALSALAKAEAIERGLYAAPIGWMDSAGDGEFAVGIRSALVCGNVATLYAGGGIVARSEEATEYEETRLKFRPMLRLFGGEH